MILLDSCRVVVTMDDAGTELENGSLLIDGGVIVGSGPDGRRFASSPRSSTDEDWSRYRG